MITTRSVVLHLLARGPAHGLELVERLQKLVGRRIVLHQGSLYPALHQLAAAGLVESLEPVDNENARGGGRPRIPYRITDAGRHCVKVERLAMALLLGFPYEDDEVSVDGDGHVVAVCLSSPAFFTAAEAFLRRSPPKRKKKQ